MTQFEFISVAVSLVLALGITRLLEGLPIIAQSKKRCWLHWFWCVQIGINFGLTWWIFWSYRGVEDWNLLKFFLVLIYPAMSFVVVAILIPKDANVNINWHEYFYRVRCSVFGTLAISMVAQAIAVVVVVGTPALNQATYLIAAFAALYAFAFYVKSPKVHHAIVFVHALMMAAVVAPLAFSGFNLNAN